MIDCTGCGSTHMGSACAPGTSYRERLLGIRIDKASFDTANLVNYFDSGWVDRTFGHDSRDRYYEETDGYGAAEIDPRTGEAYYQDRNSGEWVHADDELVDRVWLGGATETPLG